MLAARFGVRDAENELRAVMRADPDLLARVPTGTTSPITKGCSDHGATKPIAHSYVYAQRRGLLVY